MTEFTLRIDGMHCGSCIRRVSQTLTSTAGLQVEEVRLAAAMALSSVCVLANSLRRWRPVSRIGARAR